MKKLEQMNKTDKVNSELARRLKQYDADVLAAAEARNAGKARACLLYTSKQVEQEVKGDEHAQSLFDQMCIRDRRRKVHGSRPLPHHAGRARSQAPEEGQTQQRTAEKTERPARAPLEGCLLYTSRCV